MLEVYSPDILRQVQEKIGQNNENKCKSQMGRNQMFRVVNVSSRYTTPVAKVLWKPLRNYFSTLEMFFERFFLYKNIATVLTSMSPRKFFSTTEWFS